MAQGARTSQKRKEHKQGLEEQTAVALMTSHAAQAAGRQALERSSSKQCPKPVNSIALTATVLLTRRGKNNNSLLGLGLPDPG